MSAGPRDGSGRGYKCGGRQRISAQRNAGGARGLTSRGGLSPKALAALNRRRDVKRIMEQDSVESAEVGPPGDQVMVHPSSAPASELELRQVFDNPALIVTRKIEWGTVLLGFEQANQYTILNEVGEVVALMAEDLGGLTRTLGRQALGTHRSFTATVFSADGSQILFRVRRPFYFVSSTMYIEGPDGEVIGEVQQKWHPLRRNYELFLGKRAGGLHLRPVPRLGVPHPRRRRIYLWMTLLIMGGWWTESWASIDRNFQGFAKEIFTDAGKYVIHFGSTPTEAAGECAQHGRGGAPRPAPPDVKPLPEARPGALTVIPQANGNQLVVSRPLALSERMIALAAAICIDFNYFSQHSNSGGLGLPWLLMPLPSPPVPGYPEPPAGVEGATDAGGAVPQGSTVPPSSGPAEGGLERDLGSDTWEGARDGAGGGGSRSGGQDATGGWGDDQDDNDDGDSGDNDGGGWGGLFGGGEGGGGLFEGW
eukprot:jgi/Botrbrau1/16268/Bobra.0066s0050.2